MNTGFFLIITTVNVNLVLLFNLMPLFAVSCANIAATQTEKLSQSHKFTIYSFGWLLSSASLDHHQSTGKFLFFFFFFFFLLHWLFCCCFEVVIIDCRHQYSELKIWSERGGCSSFVWNCAECVGFFSLSAQWHSVDSLCFLVTHLVFSSTQDGVRKLGWGGGGVVMQIYLEEVVTGF